MRFSVYVFNELGEETQCSLGGTADSAVQYIRDLSRDRDGYPIPDAPPRAMAPGEFVAMICGDELPIRRGMSLKEVNTVAQGLLRFLRTNRGESLSGSLFEYLWGEVQLQQKNPGAIHTPEEIIPEGEGAADFTESVYEAALAGLPLEKGE